MLRKIFNELCYIAVYNHTPMMIQNVSIALQCSLEPLVVKPHDGLFFIVNLVGLRGAGIAQLGQR